MEFHAPTGRFTLSQDNLRLASLGLLDAIRQVRRLSGMPLSPYRIEGSMQAPQFAEQSILDAASTLGIDLGAKRFGQLHLDEKKLISEQTPREE